MARRVAVLVVLGFALVAAPAFGNGGNLGQQKATLDAQLAAVQAKIATTRAHASALNTQIGALDAQIGRLETRVGDVSTHLSALEADMALRERRLQALDHLFRVQTTRVHDLRHEYSLALIRLDNRLVSIYKQPDPGTIDLVLQAKSFQDVLDEINYLGIVASADKSIAFQVAQAKRAVVSARARTAAVRRSVEYEANKIHARVIQAAILRGQLLSSQGRLSSAKAGKAHALVLTKAQEEGEIKESQAIAAASAAIEAKIRASEAGTPADAGPPATPSAAGFIWPVSGPITSPFGPRWGGFHPGIDIGVPEGTPIHAAAAGTVIYCGWETGYGNLVVIDHHNGLATAYAHQSRIAVSCNEDVSQGQVIGYSGCTGYCTGPHVHFEVRVNGTPVDPLGYLP
ncbi:MAG: peptidoglycan DD-metalloendopeptidase family protein [Acidobacteriota bacterium]|nr:peptidoglycan DD-metalloendopeptidase family protein [Acidobacteriota bacterium]